MEESILKVVHETAKGLTNIGLMDAKTRREFDALCLTPLKEYSGKQIKEMRLKNNVTQSVFATYLNLTSSTIQKWEKGLTNPQGSSLKLLNLLEKNGFEILAG
ncbi:helix-turn-helix domain-containing protein [Candidatus Parabeggiatoa sp. HSG14]|uniref:helix-turn-helix domain-containing protein n=1 Tax=Candidatus Parabeggiatoa sp. HSG14 TaxID=3055593 RepID=UPI0025A8B62A|nr:helix-turn-helix domain-containing protein [Thiotrichales bacterium HSG14]